MTKMQELKVIGSCLAYWTGVAFVVGGVIAFAMYTEIMR